MATLILSLKPAPGSSSPYSSSTTRTPHRGSILAKTEESLIGGTFSSQPSVLIRNREMRGEMQGKRKRMSVWVQINKDLKLHMEPREIRRAPRAFHSDETLKILFGSAQSAFHSD